MTLLSRDPVPDDVYGEARRQFGDKALVDLTMAVIAINGWNRLAVPFHTPVGTYQPPTHKVPSEGGSARGAHGAGMP